MLISYKHKFIFIHILKTAGTAVSEGFAPYSRGVDRLVYGYRFTSRFFNALNILMGRKGIAWLTGYRKHARAEEVKSRLTDRIWNEYFAFAFVRNPWDWNVSLYFYLMGNKRLPAHRAVSNTSFSEYIKRRCASQPAQQIDFIGDRDRNLLVDYVGRYENIQEDLDCICNRLHISPLQLKKRNISKMRPGSDYRSFYDSETSSLVARCFADDIRLFQYCFEGYK